MQYFVTYYQLKINTKDGVGNGHSVQKMYLYIKTKIEKNPVYLYVQSLGNIQMALSEKINGFVV